MTYHPDSQNLEGIINLINYLCSGDFVRQQTKCEPTECDEEASVGHLVMVNGVDRM
jgi:hypothetical protein